MKQLFINIQSIYDGVITKDFGDKAITQLNFDENGKIISLKCIWYRSETYNDDLFLSPDENGNFVSEHGNLFGWIQ
jgi:hypothetical protein